MEILAITKKKKTMEETKFKVGDVVKVKSLDWYNSNKIEDGSVVVKNYLAFSKDMKEFCGKFFLYQKDQWSMYFFKRIGKLFIS